MHFISPLKPSPFWRFVPNCGVSIRRGLASTLLAAVFWRIERCFKAFISCRLARPGDFRGGAVEEKAAYFEQREWEEQDPLDAASYYNELRASFHGQAAPLLRRPRTHWRLADRRSRYAYYYGLA